MEKIEHYENKIGKWEDLPDGGLLIHDTIAMAEGTWHASNKEEGFSLYAKCLESDKVWQISIIKIL